MTIAVISLETQETGPTIFNDWHEIAQGILSRFFSQVLAKNATEFFHIARPRCVSTRLRIPKLTNMQIGNPCTFEGLSKSVL